MDAPEAEPSKPKRECQHCGTPDEFGDDFCLECGHSFDFRPAGGDGIDDDETPVAGSCPICQADIIELSYGVRQCESCGYTARDGATV